VIRSTVKAWQQFPKITEEVNKLAVIAIDEASKTAAEVAQTNSSRIDLELELVPAHGDIEGYAGGIKSRKRSRWSSTPIALFFDKGTLGERKGKLKQPGRREESWPVTRRGSSYEAHRREISEGKGIPAERFFLKAKRAGRKALLERIRRGP
jgi:hypothetical protein